MPDQQLLSFIPGMQRWFNIHTSINIIWGIHKFKDKNKNDYLSRIRYFFFAKSDILPDKNLRKYKHRITYLDVGVVIYNECVANITMN